ncbi:MAG TPA: deoxyribonuclease IV [Candidatus Acidoferrum sp.]|jgi:deoxyribonuclease-4|nr:deoxyribonuclease IV [Candidatus Acidoferrum sp.]
MPRSIASEQDILARPAPKRPPRLSSRRIGIHTSTAGGIHHAAEHAYRIGCNTLQIFSSSPRQWAPYELSHPLCEQMFRLRAQYNLKPLVIHTNYLVNLASTNPSFLKKSIEAFRGEVERAISVCADYLVLHPGSFRGADREAGLLQTAAAIGAATQGLDLQKSGLTILIENTAGAEFSLGGSFEQVAEVIDRLRGIVPIAACIDTCHTHVAGYDLVSKEGIYQTLQDLDAAVGLHNVKVVHCNDAKAVRGSKLDRHQHIGKGTIGIEPFRILLNDLRLAHAAFIAETPIDKPGDDRRNVEALKKLVS